MQQPLFAKCNYLPLEIDEIIVQSLVVASTAITTLHSQPNKVRVVRATRHAVILVERPTQALTVGFAEIFIGWPFPILAHSVVAIDELANGLAVRIHLRGRWLSDCLKQQFARRLDCGLKLNGFSGLVYGDELSAVIESRDFESGVYVDPFRFSGDSIMHLMNFDAAQTSFNCQNWTMLTTNSAMDQYDCFEYCDVSKLEDKLVKLLRNKAQGNALVVIPLFIDDQWASVEAAILGAIKSGVSFLAIMPGRSMAVSVRDDSVPTLFGMDGRDYVVEYQSVEDMIPSAWVSFQGCLPHIGTQRRLPLNSTLIHPLTSVAEKNLPPLIFCKLLSSLSGISNCVCIGGLDLDATHSAWRKQVESMYSGTVEWIFPRTLDDLKKLILQAGMVITADSVSAHIAARVDTPVTVIYNTDYWESSSPISLRHYSPFGFCYKLRRVYPLACSFTSTTCEDWQRLVELVLLAMDRITKQAAPPQSGEHTLPSLFDAFWPTTLIALDPTNDEYETVLSEWRLLHPGRKLGL